MSGGHIILLVLVAITTGGAFVESTAYAGYRFTGGRILVALVVPLLWAAVVVFQPVWWAFFVGLFPANWGTVVLGQILSWVFLVLLVIGGPAAFVASIVVWVGGALTGDWQKPKQQ